jgi:CubicO group peptidase (beta-lactamase class C family)
VQDERLAALLAPVRAEHGLPALGGAIVTAAGELRVAAVGLRAGGTEVEVTPGDRFHLGSCTKSMTATLAAVLVERGELSWDTTVAEVFGQGEGSVEVHPGWAAVTLEDLLAHRSGARRDPERVWREAPPRELRAGIAATLLAAPPDTPPHQETSYSNAGYILAGALLERALDAGWEQLMQTELFEPLGMTTAGFGAPDRKDTRGAPLEPRGHLDSGEAIRGFDNPAYYGPAGTVHASLGDWCRYLLLHLRGARGEPTALLSGESFERLHAVHGADYALGWGVTTRGWAGREGEGPVLSHAGSNTRWFCVVWLAPERGFAAVAATNRAGDEASTACDQAVGALIQDQLERQGEQR